MVGRDWVEFQLGGSGLGTIEQGWVCYDQVGQRGANKGMLRLDRGWVGQSQAYVGYGWESIVKLVTDGFLG